MLQTCRRTIAALDTDLGCFILCMAKRGAMLAGLKAWHAPSPARSNVAGERCMGNVMELHEALTQISEIRQRVAQAEVFRGYRAVPVAFSGLLALATALVQMMCLPQPQDNPTAYLALWVGA